MKRSISWVAYHEAPGIFLFPSEECFEVDNFGTTIISGIKESGKTNLVKQIIRYNAELFHKIYCSIVDIWTKYSFLPGQAISPLSEKAWL